MPDSPDFSKYQLGSIRFSLQDMGELAVRLGSADWYDRQGNVALLEDFSTGLSRWTANIAGTSTVQVVAVSEGPSGYGVLLTTDATLGNFATIDTRLTNMAIGQHAAEIGVWVNSSNAKLSLIIYQDTGSQHFFAAVRYDANAKTLEYIDTGGTYISFASNVTLFTAVHQYSHIKLFVDFNKGEYVGVKVGTTFYSLKGIGMNVVNMVSTPKSGIQAYLENNAAAVATCYIGSMIYTTDEQIP